MVLEIADFAILPGREDEFVTAVGKGVALIRTTPGCRSVRMTRGVESPARFVLLVEWESLEAHTQGFRESGRFPQWRALIGPFFDGAPTVEHVVDVPVGS